MSFERIDQSEKETIALLAIAGKSKRKIAKEINRSDKTVAKVLRDPDVIALVDDGQKRLAKKYEMLAEAVLDSVSYDDLERANLQQKAIASATLLDKSRLISGSSTQNLAVVMASAIIEATESREKEE